MAMAKEFVTKNHPTGKGGNGSQPICFGLFHNYKLMGINTWGHNLSAGGTATTLFGHPRTQFYEYLDNLRFFVKKVPDARITPSGFLSFSCKQIFKYRHRVKYLVAYASGIHGFHGTIYQASNFLYLGIKPTTFWYVPNYGLVSQRNMIVNGKHAIEEVHKAHPEAFRVTAPNFMYILFRDNDTREQLMKEARFTIKPNKEANIPIIIKGSNGKEYPATFFKKVSFMPYYLKTNKTISRTRS